MSYAADDFEAIRRREEEIKAERNLALTGSTIEEAKPVGEYAIGWPYTAATDYDC
jgi:hypothetical protein